MNPLLWGRPNPRGRRNNVWRFLAYVRPYRGQLFWALVTGILKFNLPVLFPWLLKEFVDRLVQQGGSPGGPVDLWMGLGLLLFVVYTAVVYLRTYLGDRLAQQMILDLRTDLFGHILRLPASFFHRHPTGTVASRLITDVSMAQNFVGLAGISFFMEVSSVLAITGVLFTMNARLALLAVATFPVYVVVHKILGGTIRACSKESRRRMEVLEGSLHESLAGVTEIKSYTREARETQQFHDRCHDYCQAANRQIQANARLLAASALLTRIPTVVILWVGGRLVLKSDLTVGTLLAFYAYLEMIYQPLTRLSDLNVLIANSLAAIDRLFEYFDIDREQSDARAQPPLRVVQGRIELTDVVFGYQADPPVLQGLSLTVEPRQSVALVAPSGSGKSTIIKLLTRFYQPWSGTIRIDGHDIQGVDLTSLRRQVAVVQQEPQLFSGTIEQNIRLGQEDATFEQVVQAAHLANALAFIEALPRGFQTEVGERGSCLSGGQRQRISLARDFLKDAPILVLDESTSNLDGRSEWLVHDALLGLMSGRTTILISHRLSSTVQVERVFVLEQGRVVQSGSYDQLLMDDSGLFAQLFALNVSPAQRGARRIPAAFLVSTPHQSAG
jgi:subfamily B ATP-binding cassette protein MsbA